MSSEEKQDRSEPPKSGEPPTESTSLLSKNDQRKMEPDGAEVATKGGMNAVQTAFLIAGALAGPGVLSLPHVLVRTGWFGVPVIAAVCAAAAFAGKRFADCRVSVGEQAAAPRARRPGPYSAVVYAALGPTWSAVSAVCILVALVGAGAVYLLLAAQLLHATFSTLTTVTYCMWILIVTLAVSLYEFFGPPKDFQFIGVIAFLSTLAATVLYFIQMLVSANPFVVFRYGSHGLSEFFLAFGVILFAFAGGSMFPTLQNAMADRTQFHKSINYSFIALLCLYLTIAVTGYEVYGESASPNIVNRMAPTTLTLAGNVFMIVNLLSAFVIIIDPVCHEMEDLYKVPRESLGWRIIVRGCIMLSVLFCAASVPSFQTLLALVGSAPVALLTFVLPLYCYIKLNGTTNDTATGSVGQTGSQNWMYRACEILLAVAAVCSIIATFTAIKVAFSTVQMKPCYVQ